MKIYSILGVEIADVPVQSNAEHERELMKSDFIRFEWSQSSFLELPCGSYIEYEGVKYRLLKDYKPEQQSTQQWDYSPEFQHPVMMLGTIPFILVTGDTTSWQSADKETEWSWTGMAVNAVNEVFVPFLNKYGADNADIGTGWTAVVSIDIKASETLTFQSMDFLSALSYAAQQFECEWHLDYENKILYFGHINITTEELVFEVGKNVGNPEVRENNEGYYNAYIAKGSTRNISQVNDKGENIQLNKRLKLDPVKYPDGYIDRRESDKEPLIVKELIYEDIYPSLDLYIYNPKARTRFLLDSNTGDRIKDEKDPTGYKRYSIWYVRLAYKLNGEWKDFEFSKDMLIGNLSCQFQGNENSTKYTSPLAGLEFELTYHDSDQTIPADPVTGDTGITIKKGDYEIIYDENNGLIIPTTIEGGMYPRGDEYQSEDNNILRLYNIALPSEYTSKAQEELETQALKDIAYWESDRNNYEFNSNPIAFKADMPNLFIGRGVVYKNNDYQLNTRISKLVQKIDFPYEVEITVGNEEIKGSTTTMREQLQMVVSAMSNGMGGMSVEQFKKMLNIYATSMFSSRFLSKLNDDVAAGVITFLKGTNWGNFTSETGAAMTIDPTTGQTYMEVDRLKVRLKAFFEQLEVQKVGYVGGKIVVSKGQGVDILDVEEIYDSEGNLSAYRCYFLGEQEGRKIDNLLRVDDQMICKDCNISEGSTDGATNKYYWRLVTAVSSDVVKRGNNVCHWVDLSATDCDTYSDIPSVGDTICHLGNRNDSDRQGAEILSVVDANSPSFTIYAGINSYSLVDKEYIDMGVIGGKAYCNIYGSTYIGDREGSTGYLRWNDDTKTFEIKGTIDISSPLSSGGTIGGAITSAANAYKDDFSSFTSNVNEIIGGFQAQIDGVIETWFYDPEPELGNPPASEWEDNTTKDKHLGDLYYSKTGKAYRFQKEGDNYVWVEIMDTDITKALEEAKAAKEAAAAAQGTADTAQTTAESKMKVFVKTPTDSDEYSIGDMWVNATYPADGSTYNNEILHCVTDKAAGVAFSISHWAQSSNIKTQFNNFVNNTYADDKADFYNQLDGKVETWYQSDDPKNSWATADYSKHTGDIWYNGSTNKAYRWTGTAWVELKDQAAIDAKTLAESKRRVFTTTALPTPPYDARDLWVQGENGDIMVCVTAKAAGATASASDWVKASKYTDDSALNTFINEYKAQIADFSEQLDGKIETWYYAYVPTTSNAPASEWTADEKAKHSGDLFYNTATGVAYRWTGTAWQILKDKEVQTALANAQTAQDTADNKRRVFLSQPTVPYDAGDLWVSDTTNGKVTKVCVNGKTTGTFSSSDWKESDDAALNTFSSTITKSIEGIQSQLDKKAETWYQKDDPSSAWTTEELKQLHFGDLWYNTTNDTTWYYNGSEWVEQLVPSEVFDKIDGKAAIYVSKPSSYCVNDLWILESAYTLSGVAYTKGTLVVATATSDTFNAAHWTEKVKYTDDTAAKAAQAAAVAAQQSVNTLKGTVDGIYNLSDEAFKDRIIDKTEKDSLQKVLADLVQDWADVESSYSKLTGNALYGSVAADVKSNFESAYTKLQATYNSFVAVVNNVINATQVTDTLINNLYNNYTNFKTDYTDYVSKMTVVTKQIESILNKSVSDLVTELGGYSYLKNATEENNTLINGGLVLSTLIGLGYTDSSKLFHIMSGMSGIYDTTKAGNGIAFWAGGSMVDKQNDASENPAQFLVRHDGTGYAAGGKFWWDNDGKIHADPLSFVIGEDNLKNLLGLFQPVYSGGTAYANITGIKPLFQFTHLDVANEGVKIGDNTKLYIKDGVLFIDGDLAVTGGITMYASDGVKSGMIDQVYAVLDQGLFSIKNGVITITGEIGSGTVKGITINSTKYEPDTNGIIALALNWGDINGKPSTFTPSAHNHDDLYYTETEIDTKLAGKSNTGHTHDDRYYTESEMDTKLGVKSATSHTHSVKINGVTKTIAATGGSAVDLGTYLTAHQTIYALTIKGTGTNTFTYTPNSAAATLTITPAWIGAPTTSGTGATGTWGISISGNAATATKLKNAVKLWGQSFDGSANVTGDMTSVGSITPTGDTLKIVGNLIVTGGITMYATDGTFDSAFGQQLANYVDGVTIKFVNDKLVAVNNGNVTSVVISGTSYAPTNGVITLPDEFTPSAHKHAIADVNGLQGALDAKLNTSLKGVANGLATLDASGKVPSSQLPSYVDDVLEYTNKASFPSTGEAGKIYIDKATNLTYRWSGTAYVEISQSLALGETSSTAYAGDKGKQNATDIAALKTGKADKATTLAGYGITDAYTKTEVSTKLTDGSVTKLGTASVGSSTKPIYWNAGKPAVVGSSLAVDITGNSATATKLKTAVSIWGQSFDGSKAITGNLSNVGTITPTGNDLKVVGNLIVTGGIVMYADDGASAESGFAALLAAHIDGVTIKYNSTEQKIYSVMSGIAVNGTTYKPNETTGIITLDDYPTSLDWSKIENKPSTFAPSAHTHTFASLTSKPTTIAGYGITDAKIVNGVITLGTVTITPVTSITIASGTNNGTIKLTVNGTVTDNIAVKGLGSAAYTASSAYATAGHTHTLKINGTTKTIAATGGTAVDLGSYLPLSGGTLSGGINFSNTSFITWNSDSYQQRIHITDDSTADTAVFTFQQSTDGGSTWNNLLTIRDNSKVIATTFVGALSGNASTATTATKLGTATIGSGTKHFYLNAGSPVASTSSVGSATQPIFLSSGTMTASTSTVGGTAKPMYLNAGVMTAISDTVGGTAKPLYLNAGTLTALSATVGSASKPVYLSGGSITACSYDFKSYLPLAGGTMVGTAWISWADSGNWSNSNEGVTFPVTRGGLQWSGQSDNVKLFAQETGNDNLNLVLQFGDDNSNGLSVRNASGSQTAFITATGHITAANGTVNGTLKVGAIPISNSSTGILKIDGNLIVTGGITMYATDGIVSGIMDQILVDGTTIKKKADGTLYVDPTYVGGGTVKGATVGGTAVPFNTTTGILAFPAYPTATNKAVTLAWNTTSTVATVAGTDITIKLPANPNTDTKNTAGSTDTSSKIFLIGATSQAANPQTYSHDTAYVGTDGCLYSGGTKVSVNGHTHSYLPLSGGTLTGTLGKSSNYIFKPNGGDFRTSSDVYTGAICISFPSSIGNTMLSMWIDVYNYLTNTSFSVHVGGYTYTDSTFQHNPFAMVYGASHKVRLTYSGGFKVYIGETSSKWHYPQISVRDVVLGYSQNYSYWYNNWSVSFVTSFPTINSEISRYAITTDNIGSQSVNYASSAGNADTLDGYHAGSFAFQGAHNNLIASGNEFTFASSGFSGDIYINYRTAGGTNGNITGYNFGNGKGGVLGIAIHTGNYSSYALPLSGGTMKGNITYAQNGPCYIGNGDNDAANGVGGALNNLVISSWWGVSFTTSCSGQTYTGKNAVSIDCREGYVFANKFSGALSGNASTATKLTSSAGSATLPIYFSDGKPVACTAASVFSNLSNSGNNISITVAGQNRTLTPAYATSAGNAITATTATNVSGGYCALANEYNNWNFSTRSNRIIPIVCTGTAVTGAPGLYYSGLSVVTNYTGFQLVTYGGDLQNLKFRKLQDNETWHSWHTLIHSENYNSYSPSLTGTGASGTWGISISGNAATATKWAAARTLTLTGSVTGSVSIDGSGNVSLATATNHTHSQYLPLSGGTMTGVLTAKANMYEDAYNGALNMANSNIYGLNSIYTADLSDGQGEGIHFYRTSTTVDTFRISNGVMYFAPNRTLGSTATEYTLLHSGNYSSYALPKSGGTISGNLTVTGRIANACIALDPSDSWDDGTNTHPWYGYDHRYPNTGVYSTTISDYYGITIRTASVMLQFPSSGNLQLNTGMTISGNMTTGGGITMYSTSDRRLKKNIRGFNACDELMKLGGVYQFEYIDEEIERNKIYKGSHIGLLYQNVKGTILDKMCLEREDGYGALNYLDTSFISLLAGVGIEHETRLRGLEAGITKYESKTDKKIRLMKKKINDLEARIKELEGSREERRTA